MFPNTPIDDLIHVVSRNSKDFGYRNPSGAPDSHAPDFYNILFFELGGVVALATKNILGMFFCITRFAESSFSSFLGAILAVICCGSSEQVRRITARGIIARMADKKTSWIYSGSQEVGDSMGLDTGSLLLTATLSNHSHSVPIIFLTNPLPAATRGDIKPIPKTSDKFCLEYGHWSRCIHNNSLAWEVV